MEKACTICEVPFKWDDNVILVEDKGYCNECVTLYPTGYFAFAGDEALGETQNEGGQMAYEVMEELLFDEKNEEGETDE